MTFLFEENSRPAPKSSRPANMAPQKSDIASKTIHTFTDPPDEHFTFEMHTSNPGRTTMTIPPGSKWHPKPHWHERYDEFFHVRSGVALYIIDGVEKVVRKEDGVQRARKGQVHDFMRLDAVRGEESEEDLVVEEWTTPEDGHQQVFFRNLIGVMTDSEYWGKSGPIQALHIMATYDMFPVIVRGVLRKTTTYAAQGAAGLAARAMGLRSWYEEYTPVELRGVAENAGQVG